MSIGLRLNGNAIGIDPNDKKNHVYTDRTVVGEWEAAQVFPSGNNIVNVVFIRTQRRLTITPNGELESRGMADPVGEWERLTLSPDGKTVSRAGVTLTVDGELAPTATSTPATVPVPVVKPLHLEISGSNFVDQDGNRIVLNGTDQFTAYRLYLDGNFDALNALLQESNELGFNMWRVFMMGSVKQNNILQLDAKEPGYLDSLRPFAELLNSRGVILLATVFVDAQDVCKPLNQRKNLWSEMADQLRGTQTLLSGGNQYPKNGWDPKDLKDPGMLWSRGSSTADPDPFLPLPAGASFTEFHPRRDYPATMLDSVASPVTLTTRDHITTPVIISEPIGFAEAQRPGSRSADPFLAYRLARHYSTECAGVVYHSDSGMRGQLQGPVQRVCAEAWQRGMRL